MQNVNLNDGKFAEVSVNINLVLPAEVVRSNDKEQIAAYLNDKLYKDPEFFGDFGPENVQIISHDKIGRAHV